MPPRLTMSSNSMPDKTDRRLSLCPTTAQFSPSPDQPHSPLHHRRDSPAEGEDEHSGPGDPDVDAPRQPIAADETRRENETQTDPRADLQVRPDPTVDDHLHHHRRGGPDDEERLQGG